MRPLLLLALLVTWLSTHGAASLESLGFVEPWRAAAGRGTWWPSITDCWTSGGDAASVLDHLCYAGGSRGLDRRHARPPPRGAGGPIAATAIARRASYQDDPSPREAPLSTTITAEGFANPCVIKVIGVGGGGGNAVNRMVESGIRGVEFWALNTDRQALEVRGDAAAISISIDPSGGDGCGARERSSSLLPHPQATVESALERVIAMVCDGRISRLSRFFRLVATIDSCSPSPPPFPAAPHSAENAPGRAPSRPTRSRLASA
jgi:hypothetical protein